MKQHLLDSGLDHFFEEDRLLAHTETVAARRVLAFQIAELMRQQQLSKAELARRMDTSRAAVDRLLDPDRGSATLATLEKAALAPDVRLQVSHWKVYGIAWPFSRSHSKPRSDLPSRTQSVP